MKKQLFDLTIEEFTRVLLDYPEKLSFNLMDMMKMARRKNLIH